MLWYNKLDTLIHCSKLHSSGLWDKTSEGCFSGQVWLDATPNVVTQI